MSLYQIGDVMVHNTVSDVTHQLNKAINAQVTLPIVYSPAQDYEECVTHYREEYMQRYREQAKEAPTTPAIIGWRRQALTRNPATAGDHNGKMTNHCKEYDLNGQETGKGVPVHSATSRLRIEFRIYCTDIRMAEAIEVGMLTGALITNISMVDLFIPTRNITEQYHFKWLYDTITIDSVRESNQYHTLEVACEIDGSFYSSSLPSTKGSVKDGLGSDGLLKEIMSISETYEHKTSGGVVFPNSDMNSSSYDPFKVVADSDYNRLMLQYFKSNKSN